MPDKASEMALASAVLTLTGAAITLTANRDNKTISFFMVKSSKCKVNLRANLNGMNPFNHSKKIVMICFKKTTYLY
jgi:hypothetical protein